MIDDNSKGLSDIIQANNFNTSDSDLTNTTSSENDTSAPTVLSWGRSDNSTLLQTKDAQAIDGVISYQSTTRVLLQIASSEYHTACLTSTGDLLLCGSNEEGQTASDLSEHVVSKPRVYDLGNQRVTNVSVGLYHTLVVTASGVALSFGGNEVGQLGHSAGKAYKVPPSKVDFHCRGRGALVVLRACCGDLFSLFLTTTGEVYSCGSGPNLGAPGAADSPVADRIEALVGSNIVSIAAGSSHAFALSSSGELFAWGSNAHGQLGLGSDLPHVQTPVLVPMAAARTIGKVIGVSCGSSHSLVWTDTGLVLGAGSNKYGQLGGSIPRVASFTLLENLNQVLPIGTALSTISGAPHGIVASNSMSNKMITADATTNFTPGIEMETDAALDPAISQAGHSVYWEHFEGPRSRRGGPDDMDLEGHDTNGQPLFYCVQAACGRAHTLLLSADPVTGTARILACGANNYGQVDSSSTATLFRQPIELTAFKKVWGITRVLYIAAGGDQSFAVVPAQGVADPSVIMKRHFSTVASRSVTPMSAPELLEVLSEAHKQQSPAAVVARQVGTVSAISLVGELFASCSLLAACFRDPTVDDRDRDRDEESRLYRVDMAGLEACYAAMMQLGGAVVLKLISAIQVALEDLDTLTAPPDSKTPAPIALPDSLARTVVILWLCPINANALLSKDIFPRLVEVTCTRLPAGLRSKVFDMLSSLPVHLLASRALLPLQEHLNVMVDSAADGQIDQQVPTFCLAVSLLYMRVRGQALLPPEQFYNQALSRLPDVILLKDFEGWKKHHFYKNQEEHRSGPQPFFISNHAFLLTADAKRRILIGENQQQQESAQQHAVGAAIIGGLRVVIPWFIVQVSRTNLLQTALFHIESAADSDLKKPLKIVFEGEEGIDEGGVKKEFFQLLVGQLFSAQYGMFTPTADQRSLWISRGSVWNTQEFHLVGVLLGLAVYNNVLLDIHLPQVFYRKLLHRKMELADVTSIDPELAAGLKGLLEYEPAADVESVFCRNFEVTWDLYGEQQRVELVEGGAEKAVTGDNRQLYVERYVKWLLDESIQAQFSALLQGFIRVVPLTSLLLLSPEELELLMVGQPHLDFKELQAHTDYVGEGDWGKDHPTVKSFWDVLHSLDLEDKQRFLRFCTGCSKAPIGGLGKLGLKIQRMGPDSDHLPTAHTCFNTLLLPEYSGADKVRDRLLRAINECEGFGLK